MKSLNDYFDEIYVINMEHDKKRLLRCIERFAKLNSTFVRVPGVVRNAAKTEPDRRYGCCMSKVTCMRLGLEAGHKRILCCEDDVVFHPHILEYISELASPDYDFLWLHPGMPYSPERLRWDTGANLFAEYRPQRFDHCRAIGNLSQEKIDYFLECLAIDDSIPSDQYLIRYPKPNWRYFVARKHYAIQADGWSNISEEEVSRFDMIDREGWDL